ncbi:gliding motility-associated peptidyl-prolyl isomerase GldI [Spongiimicrobium salis]|uniref:gliding motility-associated peptidyl-prolyl isomerase GldI n=1 Tax=Spongiimicrobium salis TaxID=1667022 RepID=UPI00374D534A
MKYFAFLCMLCFVFSCKGPEARHPKKRKTGSFIKESVERNKKLLAQEEKLIQEIMVQDSIHIYQSSANGSWYYYDIELKEQDYLPQTDDLVSLRYDLRTLDNDTIYSQEDIGIVTYKVDKQELFPGLRNSIKLLKEREKATFLFPSSLGYGYHGDNKKIGVNTPLKSTIEILKIEKQKDSI